MVCIGKNIANCSKNPQFLLVMRALCGLCLRCACAVHTHTLSSSFKQHLARAAFLGGLPDDKSKLARKGAFEVVLEGPRPHERVGDNSALMAQFSGTRPLR